MLMQQQPLLPGPPSVTGVAVTLFVVTGLGLSGILLSALALPNGGRARTTLKVISVATAIYSPCAAFWAIVVLSR
jgi:hypothetical protein